MKQKKMIASILLAGSILMSCGSNNSKPEDSKEVADAKNEEKFEKNDNKEDNADFVSSAVASNYAEISLAKLGMNKSNNTSIKEIAGKLDAEHNQFLTELKGYASSNAISIPTEETAEAKDDAKKLSEEKDFNKAWVDKLIGAHEKTIKKYEDFSKLTNDSTLRTWIDQTVPKVKMHLMMLQQQKDKMKS